MRAMTSDAITLKTVNLAQLRHDPNLWYAPAAFCLLARLQFVSCNVERFRQTGQRPTAGRLRNLAVLFDANHEGQAQSIWFKSVSTIFL